MATKKSKTADTAGEKSFYKTSCEEFINSPGVVFYFVKRHWNGTNGMANIPYIIFNYTTSTSKREVTISPHAQFSSDEEREYYNRWLMAIEDRIGMSIEEFTEGCFMIMTE